MKGTNQVTAEGWRRVLLGQAPLAMQEGWPGSSSRRWLRHFPGALSCRFAAAAVFCGVTAGLLLTGCGGQPEPAAKQETTAQEQSKQEAAPPTKKTRKKKSKKKTPAAPAEPIALSPLRPVTLDPGASVTVDLQVKRHGNEGAIKIELSNAPEGVTAGASEIAAGKSTGKLKISAAEQLGDQQLDVMLRITASIGKNRTTQLLPLTVNKLSLPVFRPAAGVMLQPGVTASVKVAVQRNGYEGPIPLRVEALPAKTTARVQNMAAGQSETTLRITAARDAPDANKKMRVATTLYTRTISVEVPVWIVRYPFRVKSFKVVHVKPGQTTQVQLPVERGVYKGPIQIEATDLPAELKVSSTNVGAGDTAATLQVTAAPGARTRVHPITLVSTGGAVKQRGVLVVRVSPKGLFFDPRLPTDRERPALFRRGSYGGRLTAKNKQILLDGFGGTDESEAAIRRGLAWLAKHQQADGSWLLKEYNKDIEGCDCWSEFEKEVQDSNTAGTAFGLLPFLGAGVAPDHAPESPPELAEYQEVVKRGIHYLLEHQVKGTEGSEAGKLDSNMYAHALGTNALCEAYGLSGDRQLQVPAQMAIKYLVDSQDPKGGGWRYGRRQPGDMSVTGWVFFAIRNGQLAGLLIRRAPLEKAKRFLDACAAGPEEVRLSRYAYVPGQDAKLTLTAAGLLTRQFLGWKRDYPALVEGCKYLMQNLPPEGASSLGSIYYYHYATQVLHNRGGPDFDLWNYRMRNHLVRTQEKEGHKAGSWNPRGTDFGSRGGRMYATAMALLTLEVYYRHLPIYRMGPQASGQ